MMEGPSICMDDTKLDAPLPLIGLYITAACAICMVAMGIDTIRDIVDNRLWFPCNFFRFNAMTLGLVSVACKLPVDLSTRMPGREDQLTKLSGTVFICVSLCFFMPSLGGLNNKQVVSNMLAVFIFVITVVVDMCTQLGTGLIYKFRAEHVAVLVCMLLLLGLLCSSAVSTVAAIEILEEKYYEKHKEEKQCVWKADMEYVKKEIPKEWVMVHTSSPQSVLARSALSTAAGPLTWVCVLLLLQAEIRSFFTDFCSGQSSYLWANWPVLVTQTLAVLVGSFAPTYRWFNAARAKRLRWVDYGVETFWVQILEDWKENPLSPCFGYQRLKKLAHVLRNRTLDVCIFWQKAAVQFSNVVCHASSLFIMLFTGPISDTVSDNDEEDGYVLRLPGENDKFLKWMSNNARKDMKQWMEKGKEEKCESLVALLRKSTESEGFRNMCSFSDSEVTSIPDPSSKVPLNCWTLPAVTLIAIAISLSRFKRDRIKIMVNGFSQSLEMMKFVEKHLDDRALTDARRAAEILWSTIDVNRKWFHHDLQNLPINQDDPMWSAIDWTYLSKETDLQNRKWLDLPVNQNGPTLILGRLAIIGKKQVMESNSKELDSETSNSWPPKALAGNSLYRISMTILNDFTRYETVDALLDWMEEILADIVGKCLSNLPNAIFVEYTCADPANRERRVRNAVRFLGKAKYLFESLHWSQLQEEPDDRKSQEEPNDPECTCEPNDPECTCEEPPGFPCKHAHIKCV